MFSLPIGKWTSAFQEQETICTECFLEQKYMGLLPYTATPPTPNASPFRDDKDVFWGTLFPQWFLGVQCRSHLLGFRAYLENTAAAVCLKQGVSTGLHSTQIRGSG